MQKKILIIGAVLVVLIGGWFLVGQNQSNKIVSSYDECVAAGYPILETFPEQCKTPSGETFVRSVLGEDVSNLIVVDEPLESDLVDSPLVVRGEARGPWYFEASFPAELVDADGIRLAQGVMQAGRDWMTPNFVPFSGTLTFKTPTTGTGTLILRNDNPSGLEENARELRIPVKFNEVAPRSARLSTSGLISVGERVQFEDGLIVALKRIDDSRCAADVQCVWEGELAPLLVVGDEKADVRLGTVNNQTVTYGGHIFKLEKATPDTITLRVIQAGRL